MAQHCDIFRDLFHPDAYFYPSPDFRILYPDPQNLEILNPVFCGNTLKAEDAIREPLVEFSIAKNDQFYTLMMVNLDGNIYEENREVLHWLVSNIPGQDISKGKTLCPYLQPLPLKNTGYHRICFVLFKQESKYDDYALEKINISHPQIFAERTFNAPEFYLKNQDQLTPVGLAFCQMEWDKSCTTCFHEILNMEQPIYDFEWPKPHFEKQEEFPEEYKAFNEVSVIRDIDREILQKRLKRVSPFENERKKLKFPNIFHYDERTDMPTWRQLEKIRENQGYGKYDGLYRNPIDN
uniref:Large ribosomal subunit protein mL38 n=1 Tax=Romanomermis culicivorax TaxID=13658 RepID=A0A915JCU3_ROMCU